MVITTINGQRPISTIRGLPSSISIKRNKKNRDEHPTTKPNCILKCSEKDLTGNISVIVLVFNCCLIDM